MDTKKEFLELMMAPYDFERMYLWAKQLMNKRLSHEEIAGFVAAVKELAMPLSPQIDFTKTIDVSGTGGDKIKTVNIGTISSFVLAAAGLTVGKQSTRGYTSLMGSRDLLSQFGVEIPQGENARKISEGLLERHNLAFYYHPAFSERFKNQIKFFADLKEKKLAFVTPWHLFFWIYNPLPLSYRIYGMFTDEYLEDAARVLSLLDIKRGLVVHGVDGLDEISNIGITKITEFNNGEIKSYEMKPRDFGIKMAPKEEMIVRDAQESIGLAVRILYGKEGSSKEDLVVINAGAALYISGLAKDFKEGTMKTREIIRNGLAGKKLEEYVQAAGDTSKLMELKKKIGVS